MKYGGALCLGLILSLLLVAWPTALWAQTAAPLLSSTPAPSPYTIVTSGSQNPGDLTSTTLTTASVPLATVDNATFTVDALLTRTDGTVWRASETGPAAWIAGGTGVSPQTAHQKATRAATKKLTLKALKEIVATTAQSSQESTAGPAVSAQAPQPAPVINITSVSPIQPLMKQIIIIRGWGFGHQDPFNGKSQFFAIQNITLDNRVAGHEGAGPPGDLHYTNVSVYVSKWTDTEIDFAAFGQDYGQNSFQLRTGDQVKIFVANPDKVGTLGNPQQTPFAGAPYTSFVTAVVPLSNVPRITSVSPLRPTAKQTVIIRGSGFGEYAPYTGYSRFFYIKNITQNNWITGIASVAFMGWQPTGPQVVIAKWTDAEIVFAGFGAGYDKDHELHPGDQVEIFIGNPLRAGTVGPTSMEFEGAPYTTIFVTVAQK